MKSKSKPNSLFVPTGGTAPFPDITVAARHNITLDHKNMKQMLAAIAVGSLALGVNAADNTRDPCEGSGAEVAAGCQAKSWESAEKEMQRSYEKALVNIQKLKDSQLTTKFKEAQEAWVRSRELQCWVAAYYESPAWSTVWKGNCKATEAKNRAAYLRATFK